MAFTKIVSLIPLKSSYEGYNIQIYEGRYNYYYRLLIVSVPWMCVVGYNPCLLLGAVLSQFLPFQRI